MRSVRMRLKARSAEIRLGLKALAIVVAGGVLMMAFLVAVYLTQAPWSQAG